MRKRLQTYQDYVRKVMLQVEKETAKDNENKEGYNSADPEEQTEDHPRKRPFKVTVDDDTHSYHGRGSGQQALPCEYSRATQTVHRPPVLREDSHTTHL